MQTVENPLMSIDVHLRETTTMTRKASNGVLLVAGLGLTAVLTISASAQPPQPVAERKVFTNSVVPLPATGPAPHGLMVNTSVQDHKNDTLDVLFSLAIPEEARAKLEAKVLKGELVEPND